MIEFSNHNYKPLSAGKDEKLPSEYDSTSIIDLLFRPAPTAFYRRVNAQDVDQLDLEGWATMVKIEQFIDSSLEVPFEKPEGPSGYFSRLLYRTCRFFGMHRSPQEAFAHELENTLRKGTCYGASLELFRVMHAEGTTLKESVSSAKLSNIANIQLLQIQLRHLGQKLEDMEFSKERQRGRLLYECHWAALFKFVGLDDNQSKTYDFSNMQKIKKVLDSAEKPIVLSMVGSDDAHTVILDLKHGQFYDSNKGLVECDDEDVVAEFLGMMEETYPEYCESKAKWRFDFGSSGIVTK